VAITGVLVADRLGGRFTNFSPAFRCQLMVFGSTPEDACATYSSTAHEVSRAREKRPSKYMKQWGFIGPSHERQNAE
jgi:hypothetical protein